MKKLLIIVMACYALNARSQVNENRNFLYLYSDSVVNAEKIRLRPDFFGSWSLRADSRRVPLEKVKFFNNDDGFYANTRKLNFFREVSFAERIIEGKINLYQQAVYDADVYDYRFSHRSREVVNTRMFYNKGYSDLKKVNYANLRADMADSQQSVAFLESYRKSMQASKVMYIAAGAAFIAGMATMVSGNGFKDNDTGFGHMSSFGKMSSIKSKDFTVSFLLLGLGAGLGIGGFFKQINGARNIERAFDAYNQ